MASLSIEPFSRFEFLNNFNSRISFFNTPFPTISVFNFSCSNKLENSRISVSFQNPLNPKIIKKKCMFRLPVSPFSQILASFQHLRSSMAFNFRNSVKKWDFRSRGTRDEDTENLEFLQNGGIGMALLSVTATAKVRISPLMATLAANPTFVSGVLAWTIAQSVKMFLNFFLERKWDFRVLFASGGMPSSHSALCIALTTSVALCHGVADSLFPVCLGFSSIVMYDAIGVRRHAGIQAEVLNMIIADLFQGHPISQRKLKELLGHTPSQVLAGAVLGILVACICCQGCLVAA